MEATWRIYKGIALLKLSESVHLTRRYDQITTGSVICTFYASFSPFSLSWHSPRDSRIVSQPFLTHETDICCLNFSFDNVCWYVYPSPNIFFSSHLFHASVVDILPGGLARQLSGVLFVYINTSLISCWDLWKIQLWNFSVPRYVLICGMYDEIWALCRNIVLPAGSNDTTMSPNSSWVLCTVWWPYEVAWFSQDL